MITRRPQRQKLRLRVSLAPRTVAAALREGSRSFRRAFAHQVRILRTALARGAWYRHQEFNLATKAAASAPERTRDGALGPAQRDAAAFAAENVERSRSGREDPSRPFIVRD